MSLPEPPFGEHPGVSDITLALNYQCNSRCTFCFIEPELSMALKETPLDYVGRVFAENKATSAFSRIIFSGAEATLRPDLAAIVSRARDEGGFEHVRMQTNARRLRDRDYLQTLVDAGLTEYFVSIHAPTAALDAQLTRRQKSFDEMRAGIGNILEAGALLISNTCVTSENYRELPLLAEFLLAEGVPESQIWNFVEFGDIGQGASHVPFAKSIPPLLEATRTLKAGGNAVSLSWWPACLLGEHRDVIDNHRAFTLIDSVFADRMRTSGEFSCAHQDRCEAFVGPCVGLHERYLAVLGDDRELLRPLRAEGGGVFTPLDAPTGPDDG